MKIIEHELKYIKNEIMNGFVEPFENEQISGFIFNHSKTVRAFFSVLYLKTNGISLSKEIYNILAVGELIHNASLLHDDVIDNSEKRRGTVSVWKKYNSKIAVLLGDYLLNYAVEKLLDTDKQILFKIQNCINRMCLAEFKQYSFRNKSLSIEEYIEICRGKTGSLFGTITECCMLLARKEETEAAKFAENFGIYFQLKNDLQDYSSKQDKKNKIYTANDILGIAKANNLIDNYKQELMTELVKLPENKYREELERLINNV